MISSARDDQWTQLSLPDTTSEEVTNLYSRPQQDIPSSFRCVRMTYGASFHGGLDLSRKAIIADPLGA